MDYKELIYKIRRKEIDINNCSLFFPIVIKGLLLKLNEQLTIRSQHIPHFILHTGDDSMYLSVKGQNAAIEPFEVSNENYVYNSIPRCIVTVGGINIESGQLTNPYSSGQLQYESEDCLYTLIGEFRRIPIKMEVNCKYYVDSWTDMMELTQQIISKLAFIQLYPISYLGQMIRCSYNIPTSLDGEYMTELDGTTTDNKARTLEITLEIETNYPYWKPETILSSEDSIIYVSGTGMTTAGQDYQAGGALSIRPQGYQPGPTTDTWIDPEGNIVKIPEDIYSDKMPWPSGRLVLHGTDDLLGPGEVVR